MRKHSMRKQYIISPGPTSFQYWIRTYWDGINIENTRVWQGDELDNFVDKLEADDYERAYTKEAVQKAKEEYEYLLTHQLVEV